MRDKASRVAAWAVGCCLLSAACAAQAPSEPGVSGDLSVELIAAAPRFAALSFDDREAIANERVLYLVREIVYGSEATPAPERYTRVPMLLQATFVDGQCLRWPTLFPLAYQGRSHGGPAGIYASPRPFLTCDAEHIMAIVAGEAPPLQSKGWTTRPILGAVDYVFETGRPDSALRTGFARRGLRRVQVGFFGSQSRCELYARTSAEGLIESFAVIYTAADRVENRAQAFRPAYAECHVRSALYAMGLRGAADMPAASLFEIDGQGRAMPVTSYEDAERGSYDIVSDPASVALSVVESLLEYGLMPAPEVRKDDFLAYLEHLKEQPFDSFQGCCGIMPDRYPELGRYAYARFINPNPKPGLQGDPPPISVAR